jgi:hypothetical protein
MKSINLYVNVAEYGTTSRIVLSTDKTIKYLKYKIKKTLKLKCEDIQLRYASITYKNNLKL